MNTRVLVLLCGAALLPLSAAAQESVLYSFPTNATGDPVTRLLLLKNTLYGTTTGSSSADGTVFALKQSGGAWTESTLHTFTGSDGAYPGAGLIADAAGNLYGTTSSAGAYNGGTLFMLSKDKRNWSEQTLWNFGNSVGHDGVSPACDLLMDSSGAIYGTTANGGTYNAGTVFKATNSGGVWTETLLYSFGGGKDGLYPAAGLVMDGAGVLYGTTAYGGTGDFGTVFALTPSGKKWTETVLHSFAGQPDGRLPGYGALLLASNGALYGTTTYGGTDDWGTVYELTPGKWKEKILYSFTGGADGAGASGALVAGASGAMVGTTSTGGANFGGTVYELVKSGDGWTESVAYAFPGASGDGFFPQGSVTFDKKSGTLYGTTTQGGDDGWGTVYQVVLP